MKKNLKKKLNHILVKKGYVRGSETGRNDIINLIRSLYPYRTQFEFIRLGPNGDGGYLVPDNLDGIEACFSPGVDVISEFELDCIKRKMKVYMADRSVEKPNLNISEDKYSFLKKFVGCTNNDEFITMDDWVRSSELSDDSDLILQMDIEGSEYYSFINMSDALIQRFRIMVIEFHSLQHLWNPHFYNLAQTVFGKILQTHICVHIHPNNCCGIYTQYDIDIPKVLEFTFIRKDCAKIIKYESNFPHRLDYDNNEKESIVLPENWYKSP